MNNIFLNFLKMNALTLAAYRGNLKKLTNLVEKRKGSKQIEFINNQNEFGCKLLYFNHYLCFYVLYISIIFSL